MERLKACGIEDVQVTLDGTADFHDKLRYKKGGGGTFETILKNVVHASNNGLKVVLRSNIEKNNYESIYPLIDTLAESGLNLEKAFFAPCKVSDVTGADDREAGEGKTNGCNGSACSPFTPGEFADLEPELLLYAARKGFRLGKGVLSTRHAYCGANTLGLHVIDAYGNILKCWCNLGRAENNMVGKLKEDGAVDYTSVQNLARWMAWDPFEIKACNECPVLPLCMGGCMYYNVMGETEEIDIGCSHRRHNLEQIMKVFYLSATKDRSQLEQIKNI